MEITVLKNKSIKYTWILLIAIAFIGCKPYKEISKSKSTESKVLSSAERIRFETAWFSGLKAKTLGNYGRALNHFQKCLQIDREADAVYFEMANLYELQQNTVDALKSIQKANELKPDNRWYMALLAVQYEKSGQYSKAIEVYKSLVDANPNVIEYYYELGNMYLMANDIKNAVSVFDRVEEKLGVNEEVSLHKYKLLIELGDLDGAKAEANKLIQFNPSEVRYYGMLANLYRKEGNLPKAIETFEKLNKVYPDDPLIGLSLSDYYNEGGEHEKAFEEVKKAFRSAQLNIDDRVRILMQYYQFSEKNVEQRQKSYELLDLTEKSFPNEAKTYAVYGDFLIRDNRLKEAREKYRQSIKIDNSKFLIWRQLLFISSDLNDFESLIIESKEAMELFPSQPLTYFFNGVSNLQAENNSEAAFILEQGQQLVVDNPGLKGQFYSNLGDAYYRLKKYKLSWSNFDNALAINPNNVYVLNNYAYYLSVQKEMLEQAKEMSAKTLKSNPNSATYLDTYAWILYQLEEYQEAKEAIEKAINNGGDQHGEILEHYGDILNKLGEKDQAIAMWQKAIQKGMDAENLENKIKGSKQ